MGTLSGCSHFGWPKNIPPPREGAAGSSFSHLQCSFPNFDWKVGDYLCDSRYSSNSHFQNFLCSERFAIGKLPPQFGRASSVLGVLAKVRKVGNLWSGTEQHRQLARTGTYNPTAVNTAAMTQPGQCVRLDCRARQKRQCADVDGANAVDELQGAIAVSMLRVCASRVASRSTSGPSWRQRPQRSAADEAHVKRLAAGQRVGDYVTTRATPIELVNRSAALCRAICPAAALVFPV